MRDKLRGKLREYGSYPHWVRTTHAYNPGVDKNMDDQEFRDLADHALEDLHQRLLDTSADYPFDADFNNGALTIEFEDSPARFVVSPNSPVRQIWVSAHMKSHKLDWDPAKKTFAAGGQTLCELIGQAIGKQLNEDVEL